MRDGLETAHDSNGIHARSPDRFFCKMVQFPLQGIQPLHLSREPSHHQMGAFDPIAFVNAFRKACFGQSST